MRIRGTSLHFKLDEFVDQTLNHCNKCSMVIRARELLLSYNDCNGATPTIS